MKKMSFLLGMGMGSALTYFMTDKKLQKKASKIIDNMMDSAEDMFDTNCMK